MSTLTLRRTPQPAAPMADARQVARAWLATAYPDLFNPECPVPLQVGIKPVLARQRPPHVSCSGLARALAAWTRTGLYIRAVAAGGPRFGIDGLAGEVTIAEQAHALETLANHGLKR